MKKTIAFISLLTCSLCSCLPLQSESGKELNKDDLIGTLKMIFEGHNYSVEITDNSEDVIKYEQDGRKFHYAHSFGNTVPLIDGSNIYLNDKDNYLYLDDEDILHRYYKDPSTEKWVTSSQKAKDDVLPLFKGTADITFDDFFTDIINGSTLTMKVDNVWHINKYTYITIESHYMVVHKNSADQKFYDVGATSITLPTIE